MPGLMLSLRLESIQGEPPDTSIGGFGATWLLVCSCGYADDDGSEDDDSSDDDWDGCPWPLPHAASERAKTDAAMALANSFNPLNLLDRSDPESFIAKRRRPSRTARQSAAARQLGT